MNEYVVWYLVMSLLIGIIAGFRAKSRLNGVMDWPMFFYSVVIYTVAWPYYLYKGEL